MLTFGPVDGVQQFFVGLSMAFFVCLVAVAWRGGKCSVASQTTGEVNVELLTQRRLLSDVSPSPAYLDKMAVVSKRQFEEYLPSATDLGARARRTSGIAASPTKPSSS